MNHFKEQFIELAIQATAIRFGEFTLKSGRVSPYFFNAGLIYDGHGLQQLGQLYAETLLSHGIEFDNLFGPAYKGLPLATATAIALAQKGKPTTVTFNRKEVKDHGEGGELIGAPLKGKTVMIDDVITAGTAFRQTQELIKQNNGHLEGVIIALDRCEKGIGESSAIADIQNKGIQVISIITIYDLLNYLDKNHEREKVSVLRQYLEQYGVNPAGHSI